MRCWWMIVLLGGCAFDASGLPDGPRDAHAPDAQVVDAAPPIDAPDAALEPDGALERDASLDEPAPLLTCPDDPDLVACYRFEIDVDAVQPHDDSSYGNHGLATDVTYAPGRPGHGTAIGFGEASSVVVPDSVSLDVGALTLDLWIHPDTLPTDAGRAGVLDNNGQYSVFLAPGGAIRCGVGPSTAIGLAVPAGVWTHVGCTYDGARVQLYQDGVAGASIDTAVAVPTAGTDGLGIGQNIPISDHLDGALDDVRIWRVALSQRELCESAGICEPRGE